MKKNTGGESGPGFFSQVATEAKQVVGGSKLAYDMFKKTAFNVPQILIDAIGQMRPFLEQGVDEIQKLVRVKKLVRLQFLPFQKVQFLYTNDWFLFSGSELSQKFKGSFSSALESPQILNTYVSLTYGMKFAFLSLVLQKRPTICFQYFLIGSSYAFWALKTPMRNEKKSQ